MQAPPKFRTKREKISASIFQHSLDVGDAIVILTDRNLPGPAFVLARPHFDSYVCGIWLRTHLIKLDQQVQELEALINAWHRGSEGSQKLAQIPGIGPLTATALVASIGDAKNFKNGRELAAWLGLVPRQHSSGGKVFLQGISKRGDAYLRTLMVHGARSVTRVAENKTTPTDQWSTGILTRRHKNVAAVARANKNARVVWALLAHGRNYDADYKWAA